MKLKHVVVTAVARDDLKDGGALHFARTIAAIRGVNAGITIEVLTPDFHAKEECLRLVVDAAPEIFNHNLETVERLTPLVRSRAKYKRSLEVLALVKKMAPSMVTKSGLMLGLGETEFELFQAMDDLREAMRRAKQKGSKGAKDPFGRGGKNQDFAKRSRGQQGSGQAWKPSSGQGNKPGSTGQGGQPGGQGKDGQGKDGQGGQGDQPGGKEAGVGHDDHLVGDSTDKSGNTVDKDISGMHGKGGPSRRETILAAAQKGFASTSYEKVYADYKRVVEEVMRTEKVPSSYKFFVKRYFAKIKPN